MKKAFKRILSVLLVAVMIIGSAPMSGFAELEWPKWLNFDFLKIKASAEEFNYGDYTYTLDSENNATITGFKKSYSGSLNIPSVIGDSNYKVVAIGDSAFYGCENLTSVTIPDSVTSIGNYAFGGCKRLSNADLGGVEELGYFIFSGCVSLKSITIPKTVKSAYYDYGSYHNGPFAGSSIETATIEKGIANIPAFLFSNCTTLKTVTIPEKDDALDEYEIGDYAFYKTGLTKVELPKSATSIGNGTFASCTSLTSVTIQNNVKNIGDSAFYGCENLTSVTIPDSVTSIGNYAFGGCKRLSNADLGGVEELGYFIFSGCVSLKSITIPKTVKSAYYDYGSYHNGPFAGSSIETATIEKGIANIPAFLFSNCTTLKTVTIPEKVTSIGNYAFYGCANLKSLSFSSSVKNIGTNVFLNCPNLVVSTERNSHMSIYCIDNDVLFKFINSNDTLEESLLIERKQSYYNLLTQSVSNGSVTAVVKYKLKDVYVTNKSIIVSLPKNGNYYSDSLKLDDVSITNYKYDSEKNTLTIPITQREGAIKFTVLLPKAEPLQSYAKISYTYQGTEQEEIIGVLTSTYDLLTITAPKKTSSGTIDVSGVAPSKAVVQISISDKIIKEVTASTTGVYKATVQIPDAQNLTAYVVKAQTKAGGRELESSTLVSYTIDDENIDITQFDFHYRNSTTDLLSLNGKRSVISVTDSPMTFIINTTKNEKIKGINVVSEKNGERKKIRAIYDESKNRFIASGYFDDSNHNYLPGTLYVQYEQKDEDVSFTSTPSYTLSEYKELFEKNGISYSDSKISNDEISVKLNVKGKDYTQTLKKEKIYDSVTGTLADLGGEYAKANGFEEFVDANDIKCYAKIVSPYSSDGDKIINVLKIYKNHDSEVISVFFDDDVADAYKYIKDVALKPVFQYGSMITDVIKGAKRENELYDAYWNSDKSDASTTAYNYAYALNGLATIGQVGLGMFLLMGAAVPAAWVAAIGIVCGGMIYTCNEITKGLRGEEAFSLFTRALSFIRFSCDPSGYVFEAVPSNRIEGVKTTVYYKDSKNGKAILWDASEYDQMNPLYTDSQGCYAWDVPEGYWQVKFEKEGYETTYSEWLPVPPPQLDVNVGIVSKAAPTVELVNIYQDEAEIKFSQYMDISSVTTSNVTFTCGGKTVNGSLKAVDAEKSYDGSVEYATTFSFIPDVKFDGTVTVNVSNVKNYAGKSIAATYKSNRNVVYKLQSVEAPETVNIAYDSVGTITLTAKPALAAKGKKVYFSLNDSYIAALGSSDATFDENGVAKVKVTTLLPGMAELTYNIEGTTCEGKIVINVDFNSNVPVEGISINKDKLELKVGESNTISVAITPEDASNKNIEWSSSNSKVATVNENGVVSAISEGTAEIKAITEDGKFEAVCVVTVKPASVPPVVIESISIKSLPNKISYYVGDQIDLSGLTLEAKYSDGTTKIIENGFECSPKQLTSVGKKTVTVTYEGKKATFDVSVLEKTTPKPGVKSVSIDDISLNYKKSTTLKPTIKADDGAKYKVEYSTSNAKVATVDKNGKVTATKRGSGSATITCTVTDSNGNVVKDTCKVNVSLTWWQWIITIVLFGWIWY